MQTLPSPCEPHFLLSWLSRIWHNDRRKMADDNPENGRRFFPSGAIFFFTLLILFYAALWLVIYWIMVGRA
jgi:hypothetical protein